MNRLSPVAHKLPSANDELKNKEQDLKDLSHQLRAGYRGPGFIDWLKDEEGMEIPGINQAAESNMGLLTLRLSQSEFMFLQTDDEGAPALNSLVDKVENLNNSTENPGVYKLPRQDSHACFQLSGNHCNDTLAKLCAVDLRNESFANDQIAQTSMAHVGVIIVRKDMDELPAYLILVDSSLAEYLWDCLVETID